MTNPTSNYGWQMPTSTDLVTDLPADFEVFGQAVDTSLLGLKGGTTGQVLSKTSGTDMAFTWIPVSEGDITGVTAGTGISGGGTSGTVTVTNSMATAIDAAGDLIVGTGADAFARLAVGTNNFILTAASAEATGMKWTAAAASGIPATIVDAKGDLIAATAADTVSRLAVGANDFVLTAASGEATGLKWAAVTAGASMTQIGSTTNLSGTSTTFNLSGTYKNLIILLKNYYFSVDVCPIIGFNGDTTRSNYIEFGITKIGTGATGLSDSMLPCGVDNSAKANFSYIFIPDYQSTIFKAATAQSMYYNDTLVYASKMGTEGWANSAAITSFYISTGSATASAGTITVFGVN